MVGRPLTYLKKQVIRKLFILPNQQTDKFKFSIYFLTLLTVGGVFIYPGFIQAADLGEQISFYVDPYYDAFGRNQLAASLKVIGKFIYFYVDDEYWNKLNITQRSLLKEELEELTDEFDQVIYPKERAAFGSEWTPGIDNDKRITVLVSELIPGAGGYFNTSDEYPKSQVSFSNQREMVYINVANMYSPKNKAFLAHEFQHLITFYQKNKLHGLEEEVWLNEARSEYAPTICGYNDIYPNSYLADRVNTFLDNSSNSLTEWGNEVADYGVVSLFLHYLVDHYGIDILTRMTLNNHVGIASINQALIDLGYTKTFSDVFADWVVASYLNDCQVNPENKYCYLDKNLTFPRLHVDYSASYSGFPNLIVSRSSSLKDWSPRWYRFRQGTVVPTDRDTFKLVFDGTGPYGDFRVPYIVIDQNGQTTVGSVSLENQQGMIHIPNFTSQNKSVIIVPFNQYKKSGFGINESPVTFSFTASSVAINSQIVIENLWPNNGSINGGFEITVKGENFSSVNQIIFGDKKIDKFELIDDQTITFKAPAHSAGLVGAVLSGSEGEKVFLNDAFDYLGGYPEGSLIRAQGDYKVYIIKDGYRRWIQNAEIFNFYGHLNWQSIIEVSPEELTSYQEAWLIRAADDYRVYEINADGTKHWLNISAEDFTASGRSWQMIYVVNSLERDFYQTGSEIL